MSDNVIKSSDFPEASKPEKPVKKAASKKVSETVSDSGPVKSPLPKKQVAKASRNHKFVFFESGSSYVTKEGFKFDRSRRIYELPVDEADHLLSLDNFRLPNQDELEEYYLKDN